MGDINRWGVKDGFRLARTVGVHLDDPSNYSLEEFISAAEEARAKSPSEWVILYSLADKYMDIGRHADAVDCCKKCVELKPKDVRSTYALATAYNMLTRAAHSTEMQEAAKKFESLHGREAMRGPIHKEHYISELAKLEIDVETAASQALRWFERSLELNPNYSSRKQIKRDIEVLFWKFPHLK